MSYTDINTPVIDKVRLPSYNALTGQGEYYVADRELRNAFDALSGIVSGGVTFIIAWDGTVAPTVANIPAGVKVYYTTSGSDTTTEYIGTLTAASAQPGAFYLVKSVTSPDLAATNNSIDIYDEYVRIQTGTDPATYSWEKIGDTQLNLNDIVVNASLTKQTDTVVGTDATFTITQPTVALSTESSSATGRVKVTEPNSTNPITVGTNDIVAAVTGLTPTTTDVVGKDATFTITQPTIGLTANGQTATGRIKYAEDITTTKKYLTSSTSVTSGSNDLVDAVTGYSPNSDDFIKTVTPTSKYFTKTSITGVSSSTTASKATAGTSQTTATGSVTNSSSNSDILKGVSVSNGILTFGAATLNTQTTTQHTFSNVTVPVAASSATTVLTGITTTSSSSTVGPFVASVSTTDGSALTALGDPTTDSVLGAGTSFSATTTNSISDSGNAQVVVGASSNLKYLSAAASGANTAWNNQKTVKAITSITPVTDNTLGEATTFTLNTTDKYIKAVASGANTAWNNKDSVTVLTSATDVSVAKGSV